MKIDIHMHLVGLGTHGSGCWVSPDFLRRPVIRMIRRLSGYAGGQEDAVDQRWAATAAGIIRGSELDHAIALGFDGVYDGAGALDRSASQMVVPPEWVARVCAEHPELLPGPSINPARRDAGDVLERAIEGGAVLIKWLPSVQAIDPAERKWRTFYRRLADSGVALLVHSGGSERTFAEIAPELADVERLRVPLDEGVSVVCAHAGVPVHLSGDRDQRPLVGELLRRYPNLWLDNSGMANPSRFGHLPALARDPAASERTLYGSDYPVPAIPLLYPRLGAASVRLQAERNPIDRDVRLKRSLGFADDTLSRAADVLPALTRRRAP